jgi:Mrp family chromosome partitioning ATPase
VAKMRRPFAKSRSLDLDEFGGTKDGAVAIVIDGAPFHFTSRRVTAALRYWLARAEVPGADRLPGCLAVTAALKGEGVSYVSRSLAAVLAYDGDASVALVDLNWKLPADAGSKKRRSKKAAKDAAKTPAGPAPGTLAAAGQPELGPGGQRMLVDAVDGNATLDEIVQPTMNPRLSLIGPGVVPPARRPAIARSRELDKVIRQIAGRFDHVVLDIPPVLASSDAISLAKLADANVLVVHQGVTTSDQVESALEELDGTESLGVILNKFDSRIPAGLRKIVGT